MGSEPHLKLTPKTHTNKATIKQPTVRKDQTISGSVVPEHYIQPSKPNPPQDHQEGILRNIAQLDNWPNY